MSPKKTNITHIHGLKCPVLSREGISKINRAMLVSQLMHHDMQGKLDMTLNAALVAEIFSYIGEDIDAVHHELDEKGMMDAPENTDE